MFCPLSIESEDGTVIWEQKSPNNPLTQRPLALQMGKESVESLKTLELFNEDIGTLKNAGCIIKIMDEDLLVKVHIQSHMMDMKAAHLYLGLGGAYCDLCHSSKEECINLEKIKTGFDITRDINDLHNIFNELVQEDGNILKCKNDYAVRQGLTNKPIATNEVISVQVLHALLRTFDHFMKTSVHLRAGVFDWSESPSSLNKRFLTKAKQEIQEKIMAEIGVKWDYPDQAGKGGTTTTGNTARRILHHNRQLVIEMIPERLQSIMASYGQKLSVILRIISSSEFVNVKKYKQLCTDLYMFLVQSFQRVTNKHLTGPWISITPSLHKLLAHSWELIEMNGDQGLRKLDESGLEGNNKILRCIRTKLARKTSQDDNLVDTLRRLWVGSDPLVNLTRLKAQSYCKFCQEHGHSTRYCTVKKPLFGPSSSDDELFRSLLL